MYKSIYVPVDNSDHSNRAVACALGLGKAYSAKLVGCHVYAAKLHDYRFRQMEYTLPEEYIDEVELERQRKIHDSLITMGLKLISDSYLDGMSRLCGESGLEFEPRMMDGKHHIEILKDVVGSTARPGRDRRPGDRARAGQRDRLGLRTRRPPIRPRCLGRQARSGAGRGRPGHDPGRRRRQPPVLRRAHDRHRAGAHVRQEGRSDRRLRPVSALLRLQRHRQRPHRAGGEGLPLRGAESAPRGDHRHRAGADLSVASRDQRADGERSGRRDQEDAPRRQALPEDHRPRAQDESLAHRAGADRRAQPEGRDGAGEQRGEHSPRRALRCPPLDAPRGTAPRRARRGDHPMDA